MELIVEIGTWFTLGGRWQLFLSGLLAVARKQNRKSQKNSAHKYPEVFQKIKQNNVVIWGTMHSRVFVGTKIAMCMCGEWGDTEKLQGKGEPGGSRTMENRKIRQQRFLLPSELGTPAAWILKLAALQERRDSKSLHEFQEILAYATATMKVWDQKNPGWGCMQAHEKLKSSGQHFSKLPISFRCDSRY